MMQGMEFNILVFLLVIVTGVSTQRDKPGESPPPPTPPPTPPPNSTDDGRGGMGYTTANRAANTTEWGRPENTTPWDRNSTAFGYNQTYDKATTYGQGSEETTDGGGGGNGNNGNGGGNGGGSKEGEATTPRDGGGSSSGGDSGGSGENDATTPKAGGGGGGGSGGGEKEKTVTAECELTLNRTFIDAYKNSSTPEYMKLEEEIITKCDAAFMGTFDNGTYNGTKVTGFRKGSTEAILLVYFKQLVSEIDAKKLETEVVTSLTSIKGLKVLSAEVSRVEVATSAPETTDSGSNGGGSTGDGSNGGGSGSTGGGSNGGGSNGGSQGPKCFTCDAMNEPETGEMRCRGVQNKDKHNVSQCSQTQKCRTTLEYVISGKNKTLARTTRHCGESCGNPKDMCNDITSQGTKTCHRCCEGDHCNKESAATHLQVPLLGILIITIGAILVAIK